MGATIDKSNLKKKLQSPDSFWLFDVRSPEEYKSGAIPHSKNLPLPFIQRDISLSDSEFREKFGFSKPQPTDEIIVYCRSGSRSGAAQQILKGMGFKNVINYAGSMNDWGDETL